MVSLMISDSDWRADVDLDPSLVGSANLWGMPGMSEVRDSQTLFDFGVPCSARTFFEEKEIALICNDANFTGA